MPLQRIILSSAPGELSDGILQFFSSARPLCLSWWGWRLISVFGNVNTMLMAVLSGAGNCLLLARRGGQI
ncbi:MAG: hypothetical protein R2860_15220 [Desulfobacterales bacterium]